MQIAVTTRACQGPVFGVYGPWLPDPPKHGWWRVFLVCFNLIHTICVIPFLIKISLPIKDSKEQAYLTAIIIVYFLYTVYAWYSSLRCILQFLYFLAFITPIVITSLFVYVGSKGYFVHKHSWKDQIFMSAIISAFITFMILRLVHAIIGDGTIVSTTL